MDQVRVPLTAGVLARLEFIDQFDFSLIKERLITKHGWELEYVSDAIEETKKFFAIVSIEGGGEYSISPSCDEVWHALILHTSLYRTFCEGAFGFFLDHLPSDGSEEDHDRLSVHYLGTLRALTEYFGGYNPLHWPENQQCCKRCNCHSK